MATISKLLRPKYIFLVVLTLIFVSAVFVRFYQIQNIPLALYQDETAIGYNAYSILTHGIDEWGTRYPLYFKSFSDYKFPIYIYVVAALMKFVGPTELAVRLPSAIAGIMTVFLLTLTIYEVTKQRSLSLLAGLLLCITPWHMQLSRTGFEVNLSLAFLVGFMYFFARFDSGRGVWNLYIAILFVALCAYSYNIARILAPLLLIVYLALRRQAVLQIDKMKLLYLFVFGFLLFLPILVTIGQSAGISSSLGETILAKSPTHVLELKMQLAQNGTLLSKVMFNKFFVIISLYFANILKLINFNFFFAQGPQISNWSVADYGLFHPWTAPFMLLGMLTISKHKRLAIYFVSIFALTVLIGALSTTTPHLTRNFYFVLPASAFCALGIIQAHGYIKHRKVLTPIAVTLGLFMTITSLVSYITMYFALFPYVGASGWQVDDKIATKYIANRYHSYDKIVIDSGSEFSYTTFLFYTKFDPETFVKTVERSMDGSLTKATKFGKIEIREIDFKRDELLPNTLLISGQSNWPRNQPISHIIRMPKIPVASYTKDGLLMYEPEALAYAVVDTNRVGK